MEISLVTVWVQQRQRRNLSVSQCLPKWHLSYLASKIYFVLNSAKVKKRLENVTVKNYLNESFVSFVLYYWVAEPSRNLGFISWVFLLFIFFSVSGKVLPATSLLSGVFVHRVFCAYFVSLIGQG